MKRKKNPCSAHACTKKRKLTEDFDAGSALRLRQPILSQCYSNVYTLRDLLRDWLPDTSRVRRKRLERFPFDFPQHAGFLNSTIVGYCTRPTPEVQKARRNELVEFTQTQRVARGDSHQTGLCDFSEIVDFAIWTLFQRDASHSRTPNHLLCHGFERCRRLGEGNEEASHLCLPGIFQRSQNPNVKVLKQSPWIDIASLLGQDAQMIMLGILLDCGIFQPLDAGQNNLYQLSGEPVTRHWLPASRIRPDGGATQHGAVTTVATPGSITFVRNRMFHAKPSLNNQGEVQLGLKHIHVLNRHNDLTDRAQEARIMLYVFPRQFGFHNVFTSKPDSNETVQPFQDYTMREQEIASAKQQQIAKIPRRLRGAAVNLIRKLRKNHARCPYHQLLRYYCPVTQPDHHGVHPVQKELPASDSLKGTYLTQLRTEAPNLSCSRLPRPKSTTSYMPHATPNSQVAGFCQAVIIRLLPADTFGIGMEGMHNWRAILYWINQFIVLRRFESTTLHEVCQNIKLRSISWLRPPSVQDHHNLSSTDKEKRLQILHELIYYLFDSILIPLIRSNFYVTETGVHRNRLFYFRHDIWKKMVEPSLAVMRIGMFEPLNARQLKHTFNSSSLGYSQMRLLPKDNGVRPIMNLRRKTMKIINNKRALGSSINGQLAPIFSVLNLERKRQPEILASAIFSVSEMQHRLRSWKANLSLDSRNPLYFAKVDIRSCFDTIPQEELLTLIDKVLCECQYRIAKHVELKPVLGANSGTCCRAVPIFTSRALPADAEPLLSPDTAKQSAGSKRHRLFIGVDQERIMKLHQIRKMLADHIKQNIVKYGHKHFRQRRGIPQGSVLSSLLCSVFYGDFEHHELDFLDHKASVLFRLIDDFLLITTKESQARQFVQAMARENLKHGISINAEKSLVNFDISVNGHKIPRIHGVDHFPYCGTKIDTRNLQLSKDRQRKDPYVDNGLTMSRSGRVGLGLQAKVLTSLKRQLHAMFLEGAISQRFQVLNFIFECFMESGMKMHRHIKSLAKHQRPKSAFLISLFKRLIDVGFGMLHRAQVEQTIQVSRSQLSWLAAAALSRVLVRKQSEYRTVLDWLYDEEARSRRSMNMSAKDLERIVEACAGAFESYVY